MTDGRTDGLTDGRTFAILESLSQLKRYPTKEFLFAIKKLQNLTKILAEIDLNMQMQNVNEY